MRRSGFRLQSVLELRRVQEQAAAIAAADAARAAARADADAELRAAELAGARPPARMDGAGLALAMIGMQALATDAAAARATATAVAEQAEAVRRQWTEAAQRTAGLEKLAERHRLAVQRAELAAEERAIDDVVTGRYRPPGGAVIGGGGDADEETSWRD